MSFLDRRCEVPRLLALAVRGQQLATTGLQRSYQVGQWHSLGYWRADLHQAYPRTLYRAHTGDLRQPTHAFYVNRWR
jgi:hypothetical protein